MTAAEIAGCLEMALSTVSAVLTRSGLGKLSRLEPLEPPNRYERPGPGEPIHVDVKKVEVERLMTDNGSASRSIAHATACRALGIRHIRTRPYGPRTNGKAERFIRTMPGGWAYGAIYRDSAQRTAALSGWLEFHNWRRPRRALTHGPPGARLAELNKRCWSYT
jgi:transposase InsO family protein